MKQFESFGLDEQNECLWHNGAQILLPPRIFAVLHYLVGNAGRLISHDELLDKLWPETYVQPQVLRTYVQKLRNVLGDDARQPRFIRSQPKRGYVFVAAVVDALNGSAAVASLQVSSAAAASLNGKASPAGAESAGQNLTGRNLVGRDKELSALRTRVAQLSGGMRQVLLVSGDVGMGKTALIDAFVSEWAAPRQVAVARGQCVQGIGAREQYYPLLEALAHLCASEDGERACRILARVAPAWLPGSVRAEPARDGAESGRAQHGARVGTTSDLCAALEELAAERPLTLILEDIHWADEATLDAVSALAHRRVPAQLMILATVSSHHSGAENPVKRWKQALLMGRLCTELALAPLTRAHVAELLRGRLQQEALPADLDAFVHRHAEGNPLFALAILDHLIVEGFLAHRESGCEGCWELRAPLEQSETGIPAELTQMMEVEIERLSAVEQRLLEAASLISVAFPAWAVAAALEEDIAATEDACDALDRRASIIRRAGHDELPDGTRSAFYVFAHGLYREVLYRRQPEARRARRHTRVAERLGRIFAGREQDVADEIAMHFEAAGEWLRAIAVLRAAAQSAQKRGSETSRLELLNRALRIAANLRAEERAATEREIRSEIEGMNVQDAPRKKTRRIPV